MQMLKERAEIASNIRLESVATLQELLKQSQEAWRTADTEFRVSKFERAESENAMGYQRWYMERMYAIATAGAYVGKWLQSFKEFPPRQKPGSFNLDRVMESVMNASQN